MTWTTLRPICEMAKEDVVALFQRCAIQRQQLDDKMRRLAQRARELSQIHRCAVAIDDNSGTIRFGEAASSYEMPFKEAATAGHVTSPARSIKTPKRDQETPAMRQADDSPQPQPQPYGGALPLPPPDFEDDNKAASGVLSAGAAAAGGTVTVSPLRTKRNVFTYCPVEEYDPAGAEPTVRLIAHATRGSPRHPLMVLRMLDPQSTFNL